MDILGALEELRKIDDEIEKNYKLNAPLIEKYKNQEKTSESICKEGTWKKYWQSHSNKGWPAKCCVIGCNETAVDGGHVVDCNTNKKYILPICSYHNNYKFEDKFDIKSEDYLVRNEYEN